MNRTDTLLQTAIRTMLDEEIRNLPSLEELEAEYSVSDTFLAKMERVLRRVRIREQLRRSMKNVAAVLLIMLAIYMTLLAFNDKVRAFTMNFIRTYIIEKMTAYSIPGASDSSKSKNERKLTGIELTYVPEGFELVKGFDEPFNEISGTLVYENKIDQNRKSILVFRYINNIDTQEYAIESEHTSSSTITLKNGIICDFFHSDIEKYVSSLAWIRESTLYSLSLNDYMEDDEKDELVKIAEGIHFE